MWEVSGNMLQRGADGSSILSYPHSIQLSVPCAKDLVESNHSLWIFLSLLGTDINKISEVTASLLFSL